MTQSRADHNAPTVSIIVPTHNVAPYLGDCLESILNQTFEDFELIVVDDGSTDSTRDIIEKFSAGDNRISCHYMEKTGAGAARNVGMSHARGAYLLFFDGDDLMESAMVQELHQRALNTGADIVVCHSMSFKDGDQDTALVVHKPGGDDMDAVRSGSELGEYLFSTYVGWPWDKLFKADFIRGNSLEYQNLSSTNDAYFVFTALALAHAIAVVPTPLARHRVHEGSIESTGYKTPHNVYKAFRAIEKRLLDDGASAGVIRSCQNWGFYQLRWVINRYNGNLEAQQEALSDYYELVREHLEEPDDFFQYSIDSRVRAMMIACANSSLEAAAFLQAEQADEAARHVEALREELARVKEEAACHARRADEFEQRVADFEHSPSFRIGRAITALPRALRGSSSKRK